MRGLQLLVGVAALVGALALAACGDDDSGNTASPGGATGADGAQASGVTGAQDSSSSGGDCAPGYDPCLDADASDYDCEGGTGDGPKYTGRVEVSGSDPFDLDADGNGLGCE